VRQAQVVVDQREIDPGASGDFGGVGRVDHVSSIS
jgi:hypothetical protein